MLNLSEEQCAASDYNNYSSMYSYFSNFINIFQPIKGMCGP